MIRALILAALLLSGSPARAERFSFAVFGETPTGAEARAALPAMLSAIGQSGASFAVHIGDLREAEERCDDDATQKHFTLLNGSALPLIAVPGSMDWADCYRRAAGAFVATERLEALRRIFFAKGEALGPAGFRLERQSEIAFDHAAYAEHLRWRQGTVLFVSLNLPAGDNGWSGARQGGAEYRNRMAAVRDWLERAFALATKEKLRGVVIFAQANPDFEAYAAGKANEAFADYFSCLRAGLADYTGEVMLIHGDTHVMRIDHPLLDEQGAAIARFTRIETFGSPLLGWIRVDVDEQAGSLFRPLPQEEIR